MELTDPFNPHGSDSGWNSCNGGRLVVKENGFEGVIISETHWDRAWYRTFEQFRLRLVKMVDSLLEILEENPEFKQFTFDGQTVVLEDYLEVKPHERKRLARLIQQGRILIGPWYVLPDLYLVSGEALIRNLMMGHSVASEFGPVMKVGYVPDPFGHVSQMPQIMSQFGCDSYIFARGTGNEVDDLGSEFIWQAPDGSEVFAHWLPESYGNSANLPEDVDKAVSMLENVLEKLRPWSRIGTCLLMNGSDHLEAQAHLPDVIRAYNERHENKIVMGTMAMFVEQMRAYRGKLKHFQGEFRRSKRQNLLSGVYSARVYLKQANEYNMRLLERLVEPLSVVADILGVNYPKHEIQQAWRYLLRNHAHDDICGCSIDRVHEDMIQRFRWGDEIAQDLVEQAVIGLGGVLCHPGRRIMSFNPVPRARSGVALARFPLSSVRFNKLPTIQLVDPLLVPTSPIEAAKNEVHIGFLREYGLNLSPNETRHVTLGNETLTEFEFDFSEFVQLLPSSGEVLKHLSTVYRVRVNSRNEVVEIWARKHDAKPMMTGRPILIDSKGTIVPVQVIDKVVSSEPRSTIATDKEEFVQVAFWNEEAEGLGVEDYELSVSEEDTHPELSDSISTTERTIENGLVRIAIEKNGLVTIVDKRTGETYQDLLMFEDSADVGDEYDYCPTRENHIIRSSGKVRSVEIVQKGPLVGAFRISGTLEIPEAATPDGVKRTEERVSCEFATELWLYAGSPTVQVTTEFTNLAFDHRLRVLLPTGTEEKTCHADSAFDVVERALPPKPEEDWKQPTQPTYPLRSFVSMSNDKRSFTVTTRGLIEFEMLERAGGTIALTLLRSVGWLSRTAMKTRQSNAGPILETPAAQCIGDHVFEYAITPGRGDWLESGAYLESEEYLLPIMTEHVYVHGRSEDQSRSPTLTVEPNTVRLSAFKIAEIGSDYILRIWNMSDKPDTATISLGFEISDATGARMDEEFDVEIPVSVKDSQTVEVEIPSRRVITLRLRTEKA
ncbi:MAG: alpha-mannosidase [Candidatus Thorarchaeota archaeon]|jgi:alpha-mannosidase